MLITPPVKRMTLAALAAVPAALMATSAALAADVVFQLRNQTTASLTEFYVSPVTSDNWEDNIIPAGESLSRGDSVEVTIPDDGRGCMYDILGVFSDGDEVDEYEVNICELSDYTYTED